MSCCSCTFQEPISIANSCGAGSLFFMALVETLIQSQCSIADPCNRVVPVEQADPEYDFIVVGAGVAGPVVANRLSEEANWTVLLVEAGIDEPTFVEVPSLFGKLYNTIFDWNYTTVAQENACLSTGGICSWARGRAIGGTGILNGMVYIRGNPKDFDFWEQSGNEGWGYDDLLPYFIKSEDNGNLDTVDEGYHGTGGYLPIENFHYLPNIGYAILNASEEFGFRVGDLNGENATGFTIAQMTSKDGLRYAPAKAFLRPIRNRTNLDIVTSALATKIIIDPDTMTATGVEYLKNGETFTVNVRKEVVVSGGTLNSPQLLLLSGIGPKADLDALGIDVIQDLPVGENLHNHVAVSVDFTINETDYNLLTSETLLEYVENRTGPLSSTGIFQVTGMIPSIYAEPDYADLQIYFNSYGASCSATGLSDECASGSTTDCGRRHLTLTPTLVYPQSRGTLKLNSADPLDPPLMDPKYFEVQRDIDVLIYGVRFAINFTKAEAFKSWDLQMDTTPVEACASYEYDSDEYWTCVIKFETHAQSHQAGTVKMGPESDPGAVVDPQLRVYGVPNIRVMDPSIFPQAPTGNPVASIVMVAEKGSDMIKETWTTGN